MQKLIVEVGYVDGSYSAHIPELPGCVAVGNSLEDVQALMTEAVPFHIEGQRASGGEVAALFDGEWEFEYRLTVEALLNQYSGIFTKAALSKITGINERQLWHYASGLRHPRERQRKRIENGLHTLGAQLSSLSL
jgi:predicted RNase H-like HicB family nuclease